MEVQGYSQSVIYIVLLTGISLAFLRPYAGFLLAVVLLTAGDVDRFNHTRLAALGPYLNLSDVCMLTATVAFFIDKFRKAESVWLPRIVPLMLLAIAIAAGQSLWKFGGTYSTMRACRWAIQFPLALFLGANMVTSEGRAKKVVAALFVGASLAAIQHFAFAGNIWRTNSLSMETYAGMRSIGYLAGFVPSAFLVTAAMWRMSSLGWARWLRVCGGLLFAGSVFLGQTRSVWLATAGAIPCLLVCCRTQRGSIHLLKIAIMAAAVMIGVSLLCQRVMPGLSVVRMVAGRFDELQTKQNHMGTRERSFQAEMGSWMDGTLLFGRGLAYFRSMRNSDNPSFHIAFNHLGYVTYLSQMGLIGLIVYGFYLPFSVLRDARWLWNSGGSDTLRYLGLLGGASILCLSIIFVMSSHLLALGYEAPAFLYGAIWSLSQGRLERNSHAATLERNTGCPSTLLPR